MIAVNHEYKRELLIEGRDAERLLDAIKYYLGENLGNQDVWAEPLWEPLVEKLPKIQAGEVLLLDSKQASYLQHALTAKLDDLQGSVAYDPTGSTKAHIDNIVPLIEKVIQLFPKR